MNPTDPRVQLVKETNGNTLVISLAEEDDAGEYVCQVSTYKPIEIKHSVKIRGKCLRGHKLRNVLLLCILPFREKIAVDSL